MLTNLHTNIRRLRKQWLVNAAILTTIVTLVTFTSVIVSAVHGAFAGALPYGRYDELNTLTLSDRKTAPQTEFSYAELTALSRQTNLFSSVGAYSDPVASVLVNGAARSVVNVVSVSPHLLATCMISPWRGFPLNDASSPNTKEAVVSYDVWRSQLASGSGSLPVSVSLDGIAYQVIGVLPPSFEIPLGTQDEVYIPIVLTQQQNSPSNRWLHVLARFAPGVQRSSMGLIPMSHILGSSSDSSGGLYLSAVAIRSAIMGDDREALMVTSLGLAGIVIFGIITLAGLLLVNSVYRLHEVALRIAIGARRRDLIQNFAIEGFLLCITAALLSVLAITLANVALQKIAGPQLVRLGVSSLNVWTITVVGVGILAIAQFACFVPGAIFYRQATLQQVLRSEGASRGRRKKRIGKTLAIGQLSTTCALLLFTILISWRLHALVSRDWGFEPTHVITTEISLDGRHYAGKDLNAVFYQPLLERIASISGVRAAGFIQMLPIQESGWTESVSLQGINDPAKMRPAEYRIVSPGYFSVFGVRLLSGRLLQDTDRSDTQAVAVVNASFVRQFVPAGMNPVGMRLQDDQDSTIVGVTSDVHQSAFTEPMPEIDYAMYQIPPQETLRVIKKLHLVVATAPEGGSLARELSRAITDIDPTIMESPIVTMQSVLNSAVGSQRTQQWIFISFGVTTLLLGVACIYAVCAQEIEEEKRQLAVRIALGATRNRLLADLFARIMRITLAAVFIGGFITFTAARVTAAAPSSLFAGVGSLFVTIAIVVVTSACAALLPAVRMMTEDPLRLLKAE